MDTNLMSKAMTNVKSAVEWSTSAMMAIIVNIGVLEQLAAICAAVITILFTGFKLFEGVYNFRQNLKSKKEQSNKFKR